MVARGRQPKASFIVPRKNCGEKAIEAVGVRSTFTGILCCGHWKAYLRLDCLHFLYNARHLRELEAVHQQYDYKRPLEMKRLLVQMNACTRNGATFDGAVIKRQVAAYEKIITRAEKEGPTQARRPNDGKRGRVAQEKARNHLDRLRNYQTETLRFLTNPLVSSTNNRSENDIRMTKVQQKISGCFRSMLGA